ncbi:hypothetical protein TCAL_17197 [Tigriopus californicus]|uniref:Uncharacterized protein n=1 Tax=Tigriopus californicus TaxID=6832 RepID=A0A553N6I7_TIGCA|nr:hypothetical protein TCAL_17197 [Tigriopus californicus]
MNLTEKDLQRQIYSSRRSQGMCRLAFTTAECCCIFDRPSGVKLIGLFYIVLFFFALIGPIVELNRFRNSQGELSAEERANRVKGYTNVFSIWREESEPILSGWFETLLILLVLFLLLGILLNVLMVWGTFLGLCWFLVPWLVYQVISVGLLFIIPPIVIYENDKATTQYGMSYHRPNSGALLSYFPIGLGLIGVYFWIVVHEQFKALDTAKAAPTVAPDSGLDKNKGPIMVTTTLRRGVQAMGLSLILVHTGLLVIGIVSMDQMRNEGQQLANPNQTDSRGNSSLAQLFPGWTGTRQFYYYGVALLWILMEIGVNGLLIRGTAKRNKWLLLPWMIYKMAQVLINGFVVGALILVMLGWTENVPVADRNWQWAVCTIASTISGVNVLWWFWVFHLYQQFQGTEVQPFHSGSTSMEHSLTDLRRFGQLPPAYSMKPQEGHTTLGLYPIENMPYGCLASYNENHFQLDPTIKPPFYANTS